MDETVLPADAEDAPVPPVAQEKVRVVLRLRPLQRREFAHPLALEQLSATRYAAGDGCARHAA